MRKANTFLEQLSSIACNFILQEVRDAKTQMTNLTKQWYNDVRAAPEESFSEEEEETLFLNSRHNSESSEPLIH